MNEILLRLIDQRMYDLGFHSWKRDYRIKTVRKIAPGGGKRLDISANNEYYYLVAKTVPATLKIISSADSLSPAESALYATFNYFGQKEFTGVISITAAVAIDLEFIRVIPRIKKTIFKK